MASSKIGQRSKLQEMLETTLFIMNNSQASKGESHGRGQQQTSAITRWRVRC
jgi:hypothetical protein